MKSGTIVIGIGLALVGGLVIGLWGAFREFRHEQDIATIIVATVEIRQGTVITEPEKLFVLKVVWLKDVPANAIREMRQLEGMQVLRTLDPGAICTRRDVGAYEPLCHGGIRGLRAMMIPIKINRTGVPQPGSRVTVLAVSPKQEDGPLDAKVILRNKVVLARDGDVKDALLSDTAKVILGLTPADAEKLTWIVGEKRFTLMLRPSRPDD